MRPWPMFQSTHPRGVRPHECCRAARTRRRFNPRTRVGCDPSQSDFVAATLQVSIHAPAWGATSWLCWCAPAARFQSTHPRGVRPCPSPWPAACRRCFNPRTRVGCDGGHAVLVGCRTACFNPRTRVGCDGERKARKAHRCMVSIHAPAWGATLVLSFLYGSIKVSIHAPAWGATDAKTLFVTDPSGFNPRTRVGCDVGGLHGLSSLSLFQSTHPRGVRRAVVLRALAAVGFQSTHPRGVRPARCCRWRPRSPGFNPRTRVGCDPASEHHPGGMDAVSIHAPAWGATLQAYLAVQVEAVSIHAPAWGATRHKTRGMK